MSIGQFVALVAAGLGAGLMGSIAGLASLISYPALLAGGLPPVTANVSNTVALIFSSVGSASGSRPELAGQRQRLRRLASAAAAGGAAGGALLLLTPSAAFEKVVPLLIGLASAAVLVPRPRAHPSDSGGADPRWLAPAVFAIGIYGGYFGAAAGVLLLAVFLATVPGTLAVANALKNVVLGVSNAIAAVGFVIFADVRWTAVLPLAMGLLAGGRAGPIVVRRAPATALRVAIAVAGLGLAVRLASQAY